MRIPRLYLETSVFNFVFADDAPDKKADTLKLFQEIKAGKYQPFTSAYVVQELEKASESKREKMLRLLDEYGIVPLIPNDEVTRIAELYISHGVIPAKYDTDALHIAAATVLDLEIIASWNFKHIVKRKTIEQTGIINLREGYKSVLILSPKGVTEYGK
ncbi:hypothetical protein FACS1894211_00850 [Clostridia bacterium]|nr:hypothetical protein FACS1894211_00850 [Clostridia bacterium]